MKAVSLFRAGLLTAAVLGSAGCADAPGRRASAATVPRPAQVLDFDVLYRQNCAGCHGAGGRDGAALPLANPVYLAIAGEATVRDVTAHGVAGTPMPAFESSAGGTLTSRQIDMLAGGIVKSWSRPQAIANATAPPYAPTSPGDPAHGQQAFAMFCGRCHGRDGRGEKTSHEAGVVAGSIVDPSYLALVSDRYLRSLILAGRPDQEMPDWRSDLPAPAGRAMSGQEITDVVAWMAGQRTAYPGQPYPPHP